MGRPYTLKTPALGLTAYVGTNPTLIQLGTPASTPIEILRISVSQSTLVASGAGIIQVRRDTGVAATSNSTNLATALREGDPATVVTFLGTPTTEGAAGNILKNEGFNFLNGYLWVPTPRDTIVVKPSGWLCVRFPAAVTSATWHCEITYDELN